LENNSDLIKYYIDYYLSRSDLSKSCELLNDIKYLNDDDYILFGDMNQDGVLNVLDIVQLVNIILGN